MAKPPPSPVELAIDYVTVRRRFERELRGYLRKKGIEGEDIEPTIERLKELNLVDDAATSCAWIRDRRNFSPRGRTLIRMELRKHGVPDATIDEALAEEYPEADETELALALLRKSANKWASLDPRVAERRMWGTLGRRGFSPDATRQALAEFAAEREDQE